MAAFKAAEAGKEVIVLEKNKKPLKKLYATGNGKCNFTNENMSEAAFNKNAENIVKYALERFSYKDTIAFFKGLGIETYNREGYIYPKSEEAASVANALVREAKKRKIKIKCDSAVLDIEFKDKGKVKGYIVYTDDETYFTKYLVIATGGLASPVHGSTGDGFRMLSELGVKSGYLSPALCPVELDLSKKLLKLWDGVRFRGDIKLNKMDASENGALTCLCSAEGEMVLTKYGISGIPVFEVSRHIENFEGDMSGKEKPCHNDEYVLYIDFCKDLDKTYLESYISNILNNYPDEKTEFLLNGLVNQKLAYFMFKYLGIDENKVLKDVTEAEINNLLKALTCFEVKVLQTLGFDRAQVTHGGVELSEINLETLELNNCPNLFVTGELVDVDGICGGYNLQWAWSSGYMAGNAIVEKIQKEK